MFRLQLPRLPRSRRNWYAVMALLLLVIIAFPLLGSLLGSWLNPPPPPTPIAQATLPVVQTPVPPSPIRAGASPSLVQAAPTSTPSRTNTPRAAAPTPTLPLRVYMFPFRTVFAVNSPQPSLLTQIMLYENGTDVFQVIDQQGDYVRLQPLDARVTFWTVRENISPSAPPAANYDFSVRGKTARFNLPTGLACLHNNSAPPVLSPCQPLSTFSSAALNARITVGSTVLYLAEINNRPYFILPESGMIIQ